LAALFLWLAGPGLSPELSSGPVLSLRGGGLVLRLSPPPPGGQEPWTGSGELCRGDAAFRFSLGRLDRLFSRGPGGRESRVVLPEGDAAYYAELDRSECRSSGRESRILGSDARRRVASLLASGAA
jgi:hypothetical protein